MLTFDDAQTQLFAQTVDFQRPAKQIQQGLGLLGSIIAEDINARIDSPPFSNSAMDGVAFHSADVLANPQLALPISQTVFAGRAPAPLQKGTAARIYTGAMIPEGADTVEMQENCIFEDNTVQFKQAIKPYGNIRIQAEEFHQGDMILPKGTRLSAKHMGLLAQAGIDECQVVKPLTVALLVSGDELVSPPTPLKPAQIYNSNAPMLVAELTAHGFDVITEVMPDNLEATQRLLKKAVDAADIVITTGGVSVGDADYVKAAIESMGEINFWKIAMKPGKPFTFGKIHNNNKTLPIIGLPGNPVSAFTGLQLFGLPFLQRLQGQTPSEQPIQRYPVVLAKPHSNKREEFVRVTLQTCKAGTMFLQPYSHQGSGVISSVANSTGFARMPCNQVTNSGDEVVYIPFN
ncbi:MAG: molybdopterin molybdotransferase MoeA [Cellvibrionales bacterium]|nr:molybdopterin molybdotransferase MoeA [Cellvibrionales bacterium]